MPRVIIAGAGPTGLAASLHLAYQGIEVVVVDRKRSPGGIARQLNCKQEKGKCTNCGICSVYELAARVKKQSFITMLNGYHVESVRTHSRGVQVAVSREGIEDLLEGEAALIATGLSPLPSCVRPEAGYGKINRVLTALEMETLIRREQGLSFLGTAPRIAFVQCVGSRESGRLGSRNYCSRLCCLYASRLSGLIAREAPAAAIDVYCLDSQRYRQEYRAEWPQVARVFKQMPAIIRQGSQGDLRLVAENTTGGGVTERSYDWVVLSTAMVSAPDSLRLGEQAGISLREDGFLSADLTSGSRVVAAGGASGPLSFSECIESGIRAAEHIVSLIQKY